MPLIKALVHRYRELRDLREHRYLSMVALMSLYGNPKASFKAGNRDLDETRRVAFETIPYYNAGKRKKASEKTRDRSVRLFRILQKNVTQEMLDDLWKSTGGDKRPQ